MALGRQLGNLVSVFKSELEIAGLKLTLRPGKVFKTFVAIEITNRLIYLLIHMQRTFIPQIFLVDYL